MNASETQKLVELSSARIQQAAGLFKSKDPDGKINLAMSRLNNGAKSAGKIAEGFDKIKGSTSNDPNRRKNDLALARGNNRMISEGGTLLESAESIGGAMEGPKYKAPVEALKLAHKLRKKVKEGENAPFIVALLLAIVVDFADATWFIGLFCKPFLFYFLWGKGTWKVKVTVRILLFFDCIPVVSILPLSTVCVIYAWKHTIKKREKNKEKLGKVEEKIGEIEGQKRPQKKVKNKKNNLNK